MPAYREKADRIIAAFSGELNRNFFGLCTLLNQNELLQTALQAVLVGPADSAETKTLAAAVYGRSLPNRIMVNVPDGAALPPSHPARRQGHGPGQACDVSVPGHELLAADDRCGRPQPRPGRRVRP